MQPSYAVPVTILYISVSKIRKVNYYSCENFVLLWVFAEKPLLEILHGKSVILGDCCAVGINPYSAVNCCRDGVVVGVVMDVYALNTNRRIAERYFYLWRVVGSARPLTDGEVVFATFHFLGIDFPLVVVPTNGVYLRPRCRSSAKSVGSPLRLWVVGNTLDRVMMIFFFIASQYRKFLFCE